MDRLQKKCILASAGLHGLLVLIVLVGPAFVRQKEPQRLMQIDFVPSILVDALVAGGGNPNARPPQATLKPPEPPPQQRQEIVTPPVQKVEPEPVKPEPKVVERESKPEKTDPDSMEPSRKARKIEVSTTRVVRRDQKAEQDAKKMADARKEAQKAERERKDKLASLIGRTANSLRQDLSGATSIEEYGPGGGGPTYANYASLVQSVYQQTWELPDDLSRDDAVTKARVVIGRDGNVVSAKIIAESGDGSVDHSVQRVLDKVRYIAPFPDGIKEKERSYIIKFSPRLKRGIA